MSCMCLGDCFSPSPNTYPQTWSHTTLFASYLSAAFSSSYLKYIIPSSSKAFIPLFSTHISWRISNLTSLKNHPRHHMQTVQFPSSLLSFTLCWLCSHLHCLTMVCILSLDSSFLAMDCFFKLIFSYYLEQSLTLVTQYLEECKELRKERGKGGRRMEWREEGRSYGASPEFIHLFIHPSCSKSLRSHPLLLLVCVIQVELIPHLASEVDIWILKIQV